MGIFCSIQWPITKNWLTNTLANLNYSTYVNRAIDENKHINTIIYKYKKNNILLNFYCIISSSTVNA